MVLPPVVRALRRGAGDSQPGLSQPHSPPPRVCTYAQTRDVHLRLHILSGVASRDTHLTPGFGFGAKVGV